MLDALAGLGIILLSVAVHLVGKRIDILKQRVERLERAGMRIVER